MKVRPDWWKDFFNQTYLITDARSVCNQDLTTKEVALIEEVLNLNKQVDRILDLCGGYGRHSLELARRGHCHLTVLDFSEHQIKMGEDLARQAGLQVKFLRRDARASGLEDNSYSAVLVMANSFGYFPEEKENLNILKEIKRLLKAGGRVLLDLCDADYVRRHLKPFSWHEADKDIVVCRKRELSGNLIKAREVVFSKKQGLLRDDTYCSHIYNKEGIALLLKKAGFKDLAVRKDICLHQQKKDYGLLTSRMFVIATK